MDESSLLRLDPDEKLKLDEHDFIIPNSTLTWPKTITETATKSYVDSLHECSRNRRDSSTVFNDRVNEFDNIKKTNLDSFTVNRDPGSDNELANKKCVDDSIVEGIFLRFTQTLETLLKVSARKDVYNLTKYDKKQITDITIIKYQNTGVYCLENWFKNVMINTKMSK